jgi:putative tryptophan/tyrosine transport system substrate-binding protein
MRPKRSSYPECRFKVLIFVVAWALAGAADAQVPVLGYLAFGHPGESTSCADELRRRLADLGLREDRDYRFVIRFARGRESGLLEAAGQLSADKPKLLASAGIKPLLALRNANPGIPVVSIGTGAMVENGLIASYSRPGGSITGVSFDEHGLKAIDLLLQAFPGTKRIGLIAKRGNPQNERGLPLLSQLVGRAGADAVVVWVGDDGDVDGAYARLKAAGVRHAAVLPDWVPDNRTQAEAALRHGVGTIGFKPGFAQAGGLMSFGVKALEGCRRAAPYVQRILAGADPAEMPVEQMAAFELTVNSAVMRQLGMSIDPGILHRADRVID